MFLYCSPTRGTFCPDTVSCFLRPVCPCRAVTMPSPFSWGAGQNSLRVLSGAWVPPAPCEPVGGRKRGIVAEGVLEGTQRGQDEKEEEEEEAVESCVMAKSV